MRHDRAAGLAATPAAAGRPPDLVPFEHGIKVAGEGAEAGTPLRSRGQDACACAVVLPPERPLEPSLPIVLIAMLALADGLGALTPPLVAVTFGWPDRIEVNSGVAGGVRFASVPTETADAPPDRLVVGFRIALRRSRAAGKAPGDRAARRSPTKAAAT